MSCLVLDDGKTRLGFVVVDNVGVSRDVFDEAKRRIQAKTGIPAEILMMSATHTHSAVSARGAPTEMPQGKTMVDFDDYQKFLVQRIVDGVHRSVNNLEPARIGWGAGKSRTSSSTAAGSSRTARRWSIPSAERTACS